MGYKNDNHEDVNSISYKDCRHCDVYNVDDVEKREIITIMMMLTRYRINIVKGSGQE